MKAGEQPKRPEDTGIGRRNRTTELLDAIRAAHELYLCDSKSNSVFKLLLDALVSLTDSAYGFLDEVLQDERGDPYKLSLALSDISWDGASRKLYEALVARRMEFRNLGNLAGAPAVSSGLVIANDAPHDPRSGGLPAGHPRIRSYMGMPLYFGGELVGVAGIANRDGGYDEAIAKWLAPFLSTCASIIHAERRRKREREHLVQLEEGRQKLAAILDASSESCFLVDTEGVVLDGNEVFATRLGRRPEDVVGRCVFDLLPVSVAETRRKRFQQVMLSGEPITFDDSRDGRTYHNRLVPIVDGTGRVEKLAVFGSDVTESRLADLALKASEARYRLLVENQNELVMAFDADQRLRYVSPNACDLFGRSEETLLGLTVGEVATATGGRWGEPIVCKLFEPPHTCYHEEQQETVYGRRWFGWSGRAVLDEAGEVVQLIWVARDTTDRKRSEQERERLRARLSHAQRMESIGRLTSGVAHDFNNLLSAVAGNIDLARSALTPDDRAHERLTDAKHATASASRLARQLLAFSREQAVSPQRLDLNEIVHRSKRAWRALLGTHCSLEIVAEPLLWGVRIDPGQVEQILLNLIVNARDAMPEGGKIVVETSNVDLDVACCSCCSKHIRGDFVMLAVRDSGVGIDDETLPHVFEPFFSTKEPGQGTGLATVYGSVSQNEGHVEVESVTGEGTTFRVYLPRLQPSERIVSQAPTRKVARTVVVVEDERAVRNLIVAVLEREGYHVHAFANASDALRAVGQMDEPVHLLFTDVVMPGMSGKSLASRVKSLRPGIKILFSSGYAEEVIAHGDWQGFEMPFLAKPFSPNALVSKVRAVLG